MPPRSKSPSSGSSPTAAQAEAIELVSPLLSSVVEEIRELSKKKQDGILSKVKIDAVNRLLADVHEALGDDPSLKYLDLLDEETLPQNSDGVIVLAQWETAVDQFKRKHQDRDTYQWSWRLQGGKKMAASR